MIQKSPGYISVNPGQKGNTLYGVGVQYTNKVAALLHNTPGSKACEEAIFQNRTRVTPLHRSELLDMYELQLGRHKPIHTLYADRNTVQRYNYAKPKIGLLAVYLT